ncbi:MAG: hypothetical protein E7005_01045 [Alphaproteobacteria bacterium]|nr:hypothetical protein [Alphaproteobacteria bacterium]
MKEKLSVWKIYRNAYRYVFSHLFAFAFLTIFYFIGSLFPMFLGNSSFFAVSGIYIYLFFYFAAGCYYKQQILWDKNIFISATLRFISAIALFIVALLVTSFVLNVVINFLKMSFGESFNVFFNDLLQSIVWQVGKYICIFLIFVIFFLIPSFSFVSEITGKNKSLLFTYIKTKGNVLRISFVTFISFVLLVCLMLLLARINIWIASFARAAILVFVSILYFKMYDFFYLFPVKNLKNNKEINLKHKSKHDIDNKENNSNVD